MKVYAGVRACAHSLSIHGPSRGGRHRQPGPRRRRARRQLRLAAQNKRGSLDCIGHNPGGPLSAAQTPMYRARHPLPHLIDESDRNYFNSLPYSKEDRSSWTSHLLCECVYNYGSHSKDGGVIMWERVCAQFALPPSRKNSQDD